MYISFRKLNNLEDEFIMLHRWCQNKFVYEWFEQRILSLDEIRNKYKNKLASNKQKLFIIQCDGIDIGLAQIYKFEKDYDIKNVIKYRNIYEFDLFIGEEDYLSKGIGTIVVNKINDMIYDIDDVDSIILRPFKRNIRAIKCYLKCNYKIIDEYDGFDTLGNHEVITVLLNEKH